MHCDKEIARAIIYGIAVGDALGVPYEFCARDSFLCDDMVGYGTHNQPEGTWSDDTAMALALLDSVALNPEFDPDDILLRFRRWIELGDYTCAGDKSGVFDFGRTTAVAIKTGEGQRGQNDLGNGSLMRTQVLAALDHVTDREIEVASSATHAHPVACACCITATRLTRKLANACREGVYSVEALRRDLKGEFAYIADRPREYVKSGGYCIDTLEAAIWCFLNTSTYADCVRKAVNLGDDTDTVAAVAGGFAGAAYGLEGIPKGWLERLRGKRAIEDVLSNL